MLMKLGKNICTNDIWAELENGWDPLKNIAARGRGIFPNMAL